MANIPKLIVRGRAEIGKSRQAEFRVTSHAPLQSN